MNILDNELVLKYFGCEGPIEQRPMMMAWKILLAMQEPIRKGERYLCIQIGLEKMSIIELEEPTYEITGFHGWYLRLPDRFQRQEKNRDCTCQCHFSFCTCSHAGCASGYNHKPTPSDAVEEKIKEITFDLDSTVTQPVFVNKIALTEQLRELVKLVKEQR